MRFEPLEERHLLVVIAWDGGLNSSGTDWNDPVNWAGDQLPGPTDNVVIGSLFADNGITIRHSAGTTTINSLNTEANVEIAGGALTIRDNSTLNSVLHVGGAGVLTLESLTLSGTGILANEGTVENLNSTINVATSNQGLLVARGGLVTINGDLTTSPNSTLRLQGDNTFNSSFLTMAAGFTNQGTIELTSTGSIFHATLAVTNGTLTNAATGEILSLPGSGGNRAINASLDNLGTLTVSRALTIGNGGKTFTNTSGTVQGQSSETLTVNGGTTVLGSASVLTGLGQIDLAGTHSLNLASDLTLTSFTPTLILSGGVTVNGPGTLVNQTTLELTNDTVNANLDNQGLLLARGGIVAIKGTFTTSPKCIAASSGKKVTGEDRTAK